MIMQIFIYFYKAFQHILAVVNVYPLKVEQTRIDSHNSTMKYRVEKHLKSGQQDERQFSIVDLKVSFT